MLKTQAEQQDSTPTASDSSDERGYKPALRYHSPTAAEQETRPVTVERSVELSVEYSTVDTELQNRQLLSLRHATSSTHHVDAEVADNGNGHDLVGTHSDG